jgi:hypothetical protein
VLRQDDRVFHKRRLNARSSALGGLVAISRQHFSQHVAQTLRPGAAW